MSELYEKSLLKLELDQVLGLLAECAGSAEGKAACLRLHPTSDLEDVQMCLGDMETSFCIRDLSIPYFFICWYLGTNTP